MAVKAHDLSWIVVTDLDKAIRFFTEVVGLKLDSRHNEANWAELSGHDGGARLGIGIAHQGLPIKPGQNAIMTFTVQDIDKERARFSQKGGQLVGEVLEVPHIVKLQFFKDADGNLFQFVQDLEGHK